MGYENVKKGKIPSPGWVGGSVVMTHFGDFQSDWVPFFIPKHDLIVPLFLQKTSVCLCLI